MSAAAASLTQTRPRMALLGTGTVGSAFVHRYCRLQHAGHTLPTLRWLANSRGALDCAGDPLETLQRITRQEPRAVDSFHQRIFADLRAGDVVVDASNCAALAGEHAGLLRQGIHVATANKLGAGAALSDAQAIAHAQRGSGARYGDGATVGAGLPVLSSVRELTAGGDRIHAIEGVLSGSMAWLLDHFDGTVPFSQLVGQAQAAGYTEPDPRIDLSGEDVRRKLLILARAAGWPLEESDIRVEPLLPGTTAVGGSDNDGWQALDAFMQARWRQAQAENCRLVFVGRVSAQGGQIALQALPVAEPLRGGSGTDNRVVIRSDRYDTRPLVLQGPGAGAEVTAAALLDDVQRFLR